MPQVQQGMQGQGQQSNRNRQSQQLLVPGAAQALNQMKFEIAQEFGVQLGPDTTSRSNGSVGGEITRRLVALAQQQLGGGTTSAVTTGQHLGGTTY
jgi:small acid-soluble spore protein A (major alpha-type SASP)